MTSRVLHVLASDDRRGAEVFATDLASQLEELGWESTLVSLSRSSSDATVDATPIDGGRISQLLPLRREAGRHDVVIAHGSTSLPACAIACLGSTPFVYRSIGDPTYWSSDGLRRLRTQALLNRARTVVALFDSAAEALRSRGIRSEIQVIPNAVRAQQFPAVTDTARVDARAALGIGAEASVVLFLGALSREKRPERAITLARTDPALSVLVVGDGPMRDELQAQADTVPNATVHGPTSTPALCLAAADVVIVPSDTEGIPAVAIEAGLRGLPVVASDVGGLSSVIAHGRTGLLVPPGDDAALAAAVQTALRGGAEMGSAARQHCLERFDITAVARQWAEVIQRAAKPRTGT